MYIYICIYICIKYIYIYIYIYIICICPIIIDQKPQIFKIHKEATGRQNLHLHLVIMKHK